jgi:hypothetical protein
MKVSHPKALAIGLLCSLVCISACTTKGASPPNDKEHPTNYEYKAMKTDSHVEDPELYFGDLGIEQFIYGYRSKGLGSTDPDKKQLFDPNGFPLIHQFPNPSIQPVGGNYRENLIEAARAFMGTPYIYGSDRTEPSSFDCSDFTRWVFLSALGMDLPWDSRSQAAYVRAFSPKTYTSLEDAQRGDLLFFSSYRGNHPSDYIGLTPSEMPITHMGIALGDGQIIHSASKKSGGVRVDKLNWRQLNNRFVFGGGILP